MTIGMVSGSFDPIQRGHAHMIKKAVGMVDKLYVTIARNTTKGKSYFDDKVKFGLVVSALQHELSDAEMSKVTVMFSDEGMIVDHCDVVGATIIFRGIRNANDFIYEQNMEQYNAEFAPHITTVFLMTPPEMAKISSSAIKGIVGLRNWATRIEKFVHPATLAAFTAVQHRKDQCYTVIGHGN